MSPRDPQSCSINLGHCDRNIAASVLLKTGAGTTSPFVFWTLLVLQYRVITSTRRSLSTWPERGRKALLAAKYYSTTRCSVVNRFKKLLVVLGIRVSAWFL